MKKSEILMRLPPYLLWPLLFLGHLLAVSLIAWHLLAQINFAYPLGYRLLGLDKHIAEYAPLNRNIHGFEYTKAHEHWELFSQITDAVQHRGQGLADITFSLPNNIIMPLLTHAEIIHLHDVSELIHYFYVAGITGGLLWAVLLAIAWRQKQTFPSVRHIASGFFGAILVTIIVILSVGPTDVFYWFHVKIFPEGHQWFFYYEDSLMTTLMKAPDIFAFIAALLLTTLTIIWSLSCVGMNRLLNTNR